MSKSPFRVSTSAAKHASAEERPSPHPGTRPQAQTMTNPDRTLPIPSDAPAGRAHGHSPEIQWPKDEATHHPPLGTGRVNAPPFKNLRGGKE